jgi:murein DD-endopeptidase MepM/ murein hydrolase activator NlpD
VNVAHHGLKDGKAILRVKVSDYSWRGWWKGNQTYKELPILIDTEPPTIEVLTSQHNLNQGGTGLAVYELSESVDQSGMQVGDRFFQGYSGYFDEPNRYLVFFALSHAMGPDTQLYVSATDGAGNTAKRGISCHINAKAFAEDTLHISDAFLRRKMPEFEPFSFSKSPPDSLLDKFLAVNQDLRMANYDTLQGVCQASDGEKHWAGPFLRLPGSARKAGFADRRTYLYEGKAVDKQYHLGIDLASTAQSPVPASNTGKVCFADNLGIYGKTVVIDHGFSLFSMYSHLSRLSVSTDQVVSKGDTIGLTGTTGMAGGDHLHFSMLVQGTFVNPVEWWDDNWIKHNITDKLSTLKQ